MYPRYLDRGSSWISVVVQVNFASEYNTGSSAVKELCYIQKVAGSRPDEVNGFYGFI
jgi:hypothetical protein